MAEALWDGFSRAVSRQLRKAAATRSLKGRGKQSARSSVAIRHEDHELTSVEAPFNASCFLSVWECERMRSSVRPVYAAFQTPLAGMEIRGSVPHHSGGLIIPV